MRASAVATHPVDTNWGVPFKQAQLREQRVEVVVPAVDVAHERRPLCLAKIPCAALRQLPATRIGGEDHRYGATTSPARSPRVAGSQPADWADPSRATDASGHRGSSRGTCAALAEGVARRARQHDRVVHAGRSLPNVLPLHSAKDSGNSCAPAESAVPSASERPRPRRSSRGPSIDIGAVHQPGTPPAIVGGPKPMSGAPSR